MLLTELLLVCDFLLDVICNETSWKQRTNHGPCCHGYAHVFASFLNVFGLKVHSPLHAFPKASICNSWVEVLMMMMIILGNYSVIFNGFTSSYVDVTFCSKWFKRVSMADMRLFRSVIWRETRRGNVSR